MKKLGILFFVLVCVVADLLAQTSKGWDVPVKDAVNKNAGNTHALIVGVSKYKNLPSQLKYADKDARVFYNYLLTSGVAPQNVHLLLNEDALKGSIWAEVEYLLDVAKAGDKVYVYFSGHGDVERKTIGHKAYLLPYDSETRGYVSCAVGIPDLKDYFATLSASGVQLIFIGDACRVGNLAGGMDGISTTASLLQEQWTDEIKILSCQPGQLSQESKQWGDGRGLFSFELINGLCGMADKNKNNEVTLRELELYLLEKVPEAADPNQQDPIVETKTKDYVISYLSPEIKKLASSQPSNLLATIDMKGSESLLLEHVNDDVKFNYKRFQECMDSANYVQMERTDWKSIYSSNLSEIDLLPSALYYYKRINAAPENEMLLAFMKRNLSAALMNDLQTFMATGPETESGILADGSEDYTHLVVMSMMDKLNLVSSEAAALKELIGYEKLKKLGFYSTGILLEATNPSMFQNMDRLNEMNSMLDSALYYEPELRDLNLMKGACLMGLQRFKESKYYLEREIAGHPSNTLAYGHLANIYFAENKTDSLFRLFRQCYEYTLNLDESDESDMHRFNALYVISAKLIQFNQLDSAEFYFLEMIKRPLPKMSEARATGIQFYISVYATYFGLCDEAEKYYNLASSHGNYDRTALAGIASCFIKANDFVRGKKYIEVLKTQEIVPYYDLACLYSMMHELKTAFEYFEKFALHQKDTLPYPYIFKDPDLANLRASEDFIPFMRKFFPKEFKE